MAPLGFRRILRYIKDEYGNPPVIVTENGLSENGPIDLNDEHRSYFYENHVNQLLKGTNTGLLIVALMWNTMKYVFF